MVNRDLKIQKFKTSKVLLRQILRNDILLQMAFPRCSNQNFPRKRASCYYKTKIEYK